MNCIKKMFFILIMSSIIFVGCKSNNNFKYISTFKNNYAKVEIEKNSYLMDKRGRILNKEGYQDISNMSNNKAYFKKDEKYGFMDDKGNVIIEPKYDFLTKGSENVYILRANNKYGHYVLDKEILVEPKYDLLYQFKNGYAFVKENGLGKYIDYKGNVLIDRLYRGLNFDNNLAIASRYFDEELCDYKKLGITKEDSKKGHFLIDTKGNTYLDFDETKPGNHKRLYFINYNKGKYYFYDNFSATVTKGVVYYSFDEKTRELKNLNVDVDKLVKDNTTVIWFVNEEIIIVSNDKGNTVIDKDGIPKFEYVDGDIMYIKDLDLYSIVKNNKKYILNSKFENIIDMEYDEIYFNSSKYIRIKKDGKIGMVDTLGNIITKPMYDEIGPMFVEGHIRVKVKDKWGYMNEKGDLDIECKFDRAYCFKEGLAPVCKDGKWGFIDKDGKLAIDYKYDRVQKFSEGLSAVYEGDKAYYINKKGEIVLE
ncbi:WG repeat-containing protein [Peptostreptococcaceae bacterium AGR-M142]